MGIGFDSVILKCSSWQCRAEGVRSKFIRAHPEIPESGLDHRRGRFRKYSHLWNTFRFSKIPLPPLNTAKGYFRMRSRTLFLFLTVLLCGCDEREVISGLDQRDKISVLSIMSEAGISTRVEKSTKGKEDRFSISVSEGNYTTALELLTQLGLPRKESLNTRSLLSGDSLIPPTPDVVQLRLELITSERLRELIQALPSVIDSEVYFHKEGAKARGSVFVRHSGINPELENLVRDLSIKLLPDVDPSDLEVRLFIVSLTNKDPSLEQFPRPFSFRVLSSERATATIQVFSWLGVSILAALFVGFYAGLVVSSWMWRRLERRRAERRRTGEYPLVSLKTATNLPAQQEESE